MIEPRKYTTEEITSIIEALRVKFPELMIDLYRADKRFIRVSKVLRELRVDTIPVSLTHMELIHIVEAEQIIKS
jgi:hypothetical protein